MRVIPSLIRSKPWAESRVNLAGRIHHLGCGVIGFHEPDFLAQSRGGRRERQNKNLTNKNLRDNVIRF
jgi:hypothetical protein